MKTELKPCQCGCNTVEIIHIPGKRQMILTCPKCRTTINHKYIRMNPDELRKAIVKAWNTRPIEDALQSRITELEKQVANSVSKIELDTCRSLNEALRQREDRMRKAMLNAGFVWSEDEFKEIEK